MLLLLYSTIKFHFYSKDKASESTNSSFLCNYFIATLVWRTLTLNASTDFSIELTVNDELDSFTLFASSLRKICCIISFSLHRIWEIRSWNTIIWSIFFASSLLLRNSLPLLSCQLLEVLFFNFKISPRQHHILTYHVSYNEWTKSHP